MGHNRYNELTIARWIIIGGGLLFALIWSGQLRAAPLQASAHSLLLSGTAQFALLLESGSGSDDDAEEAAEDAADEAEDALDDELDDLEDALDDELDEMDDDFDDAEDALDEDNSGHGGGDEEDDEEDEEDEENNSGSGSGDGDGDDERREATEEDEDDDRRGRGRGRGRGGDDDRERAGESDDDDDRRGRGRGRGRGDADDDDDYEEFIDDDGYPAADGEVLVMVERERLESGDLDSLDVEAEYDLDGLDLVMVRVRVGEGEDEAERLLELEDMFGEDTVELNHSYSTEARFQQATTGGISPRDAARPLGIRGDGTGLRIGMIDTAVDSAHPALSSIDLVAQDFVEQGGARSSAHGTMIASIFAGKEIGEFSGISPGAQLYAANIFFLSDDGEQVAGVEGLIRALDWLVQESVPIVNVSLSGPPNRLLERAVRRASDRGVLVVAAVGNAGPAAPPLYPAAYDEVVAVTAVDGENRPYRRAVRGAHLDLAAPGVALRSAQAGAGYTFESGTSLAAPFVTVALAAAGTDNRSGWPEILKIIETGARDLGKKGHDPVFGHGLIQSRAPTSD